MIIDNISNENTFISSIKDFLLDNYKQICLFILVFIIIFIVEYISNINAILYGATQIPGINMGSQSSLQKTKKNISFKKKRKYKK
jgi:hypothetical protein